MADKLDLLAARERRGLAEFSIMLAAGLGLAALLLFLFAVPFAGNMAASRDFVPYWATGQQLVHHANPYDREAISRLEHDAGFGANFGLIMRNPPWALPLVYPLGFVGLGVAFRVAFVLWTLLLLGCLLLSVSIVRKLHGSPPDPIHWLGLAFPPALICIAIAQTSLFSLLGLVLFLRFHRSRPLTAGAALWLCALKPHLFLPFAAALLAWIVVSRSYKLLAGAAAPLVLSSAAAFLIAPTAWSEYNRMMRSPGVENEFVPCLADALRHWLWPQYPWTRYLPAVLACAWALVYFWRRRRAWDWIRNSSPLMLIALLAAPYSLLYDQGVLIPALMDGAYRTRSRHMLAALAFLILAVDAEFCRVEVLSKLYLWTAPAWFVWYLLARAATGEKSARPATTPA